MEDSDKKFVETDENKELVQDIHVCKHLSGEAIRNTDSPSYVMIRFQSGIRLQYSDTEELPEKQIFDSKLIKYCPMCGQEPFAYMNR